MTSKSKAPVIVATAVIASGGLVLMVWAMGAREEGSRAAVLTVAAVPFVAWAYSPWFPTRVVRARAGLVALLGVGFVLQLIALMIAAYHDEEQGYAEETLHHHVRSMYHLGVEIREPGGSGAASDDFGSRMDRFLREAEQFESDRHSLAAVNGVGSALSDLGLVAYTVAPLLLLDVWIVRTVDGEDH